MIEMAGCMPQTRTPSNTPESPSGLTPQRQSTRVPLLTGFAPATVARDTIEMEQKLQIFISSSKTDLEEERNAVSLAILRAKHIPAGMEIAAGVNDKTLSIVYGWIDACNVFVVLLGGRYGTPATSQKLSYTHLEYRRARERGIPIIALVLTERYLGRKVANGNLADEQVFETRHADKYRAFLKEVTEERYYSAIDDLGEIEPALSRAFRSMDSTAALNGWVRRDDCLAFLTDIYSAYTDLHAAEAHRLSVPTEETIEHMLGALHLLCQAVISPALGWIDVLVPCTRKDSDRPHLLFDGPVEPDHWLRLKYSSVPRTSVPPLIPIEVHGIPWQGSGTAFRTGEIDYVGSTVDAFSFTDRTYSLAPVYKRKIKDKYKNWYYDYNFAALLSICIRNSSRVPVAVLNLNFRQTYPFGRQEAPPLEIARRIRSVTMPTARIIVKALSSN